MFTPLVRRQTTEDNQLHFGVTHFDMGVAETQHLFVNHSYRYCVGGAGGCQVARPVTTNYYKTHGIWEKYVYHWLEMLILTCKPLDFNFNTCEKLYF